uniref:Uncharacterized protein LOC114343643 n=1 Tax=Diabrotica virgifera virgifera TaxID=50390 RepID=A0A6P7GK35_DIAVI
MKIFLAILTFWSIQKFGSTYNILGVFTFCQHSHFTLGFQLLKSLADSGHNVTMISCFPQQKPIKNWVDISVRVGTNQDQVLGILARGPELQTMTHWTKLNFMAALGETYSSATFEVKAVQALLKVHIEELDKRYEELSKAKTKQKMQDTKTVSPIVGAMEDSEDVSVYLEELEDIEAAIKKLSDKVQIEELDKRFEGLSKEKQKVQDTKTVSPIVGAMGDSEDVSVYLEELEDIEAAIKKLSDKVNNITRNDKNSNLDMIILNGNVKFENIDANKMEVDNISKKNATELLVDIVSIVFFSLCFYILGAPDLRSILYNTSLLLISSHVSFIDPIPLQQNVIPIGGFHVTPPEPLPKKIKHFLDTAPHGVILFSMGSNKGITFNVRQKKDMLKVFAKLSQKVICNVDFASIETPENVLVADWLPQKDILAHPNTVAFISHGGLLGTTEAVYFGVPILGIPVYWDQAKNIEEVVAKGFAVRLDAEDIDEQTFEASLKRLINDPSYRRNAKERSQILRDQSVNQRDQAVFWVEYVIRHKGAHHLKSAALKLKWYQRYLLDIILFVTVASVFIIFAIYYCIKLLASIKNQTKLKDKVY